MKYDRFDLEEEIMNLWQTEDDLDAVVHRMMEDPDPITKQEITDLIISIGKIHNLRCQKLFDIFEKMVIDNCFVNKGTSLDYRGVPLDDEEDSRQATLWDRREIEEY
jgi:hypothetical protein